MCVGFAALAKADMKFSRGLRYTGVGAVSCARGEFIVTVGNLQKGERLVHIFEGLLKMLTCRYIRANGFCFRISIASVHDPVVRRHQL